MCRPQTAASTADGGKHGRRPSKSKYSKVTYGPPSLVPTLTSVKEHYISTCKSALYKWS